MKRLIITLAIIATAIVGVIAQQPYSQIHIELATALHCTAQRRTNFNQSHRSDMFLLSLSQGTPRPDLWLVCCVDSSRLVPLIGESTYPLPPPLCLPLSLLCSNWTLVNTHAWPARASATSAYFPSVGTTPGRWIVIGGFTRTETLAEVTLADAYTSDDAGVTWQLVNTTLPFTRCEMAADVVQTQAGYTLVVSGGIDFETYTNFNVS